jgi:hypothetical protein
MDSAAAAYGMYSGDVEIVDVVQALNGAGFRKEDMCLMLAPSQHIAESMRGANLLNAEATATAVSARVIAWCSEFGAVVIPTVGFFIRSQVFLRALVVARNAPAFCGRPGTLAGLGFSDSDAERLEKQLQQAGFLVYVASQEPARVRWATELLRGTGAVETATLEREARAVA